MQVDLNGSLFYRLYLYSPPVSLNAVSVGRGRNDLHCIIIKLGIYPLFMGICIGSYSRSFAFSQCSHMVSANNVTDLVLNVCAIKLDVLK